MPPGTRGKPRDDHVGPEGADDPHDVRHHLLPVPDLERLAIILRKTEVDGAREKLPAAVEAAGGEQFLGADHAELLAELGTEHVLAAVAAGEREVGGAVIPAARQVGDELGVFIVRMRGDVEHAAHFAKAAQQLQNGGGGRFSGPAGRIAGQQTGAGHGKAWEPGECTGLHF